MLPGEVANGRFVEFSLPEIWFCGMGAHEKAHQPDWLESHGSLSRQPVFVPVRDQTTAYTLLPLAAHNPKDRISRSRARGLTPGMATQL